MRRLLCLVAWSTFLLGAIVALQALGHGSLAPPPLSRPSSWGEWAATRSPEQLAAAALRLLLVAATGYLLAVTLVGVGAGLLGARRLVAAVDGLTIPGLRGAIRTAVGAGLTASLTSGALVAATAGAADAAPRDRATLHAEDPTPPAPVPPPASASASAPVAVPLAADSAPATWQVAHGDHLWSIAEHVVEQSWGRPASDREIASYWRTLVEANRSALADPDNPDLIYPGQQFVLPPAPRP